MQKLWINVFLLIHYDAGHLAPYVLYLVLIDVHFVEWMPSLCWFLNSTGLSCSFQFHLCLQPEPATEPSSALVPFLQKYADVSNKKQSVGVSPKLYLYLYLCGTREVPLVEGLSLVLQVLKLELKEIRKQQDLLFRFMNFLKQEGAVHVLQFCLAVGEKNQIQTSLHILEVKEVVEGGVSFCQRVEWPAGLQAVRALSALPPSS